jgi:murein tripeptide amidase MpaA
VSSLSVLNRRKILIADNLGEWISPATLTYIMNELLTSTDPDIVEVANYVDWYFIPFANPGKNCSI